MTQENMAAELLRMRRRAEQMVRDISQAEHGPCPERQNLRQVISEYGTKRIELLKEELHARGLTWCTRCSTVLPEGEVELLLLEGREEYSCGHENSCYSFRDFSRLHRVCPRCREKASDKHGTRGSYDTMAKDQTSFYAFRVEKREDGYYAREFGDWIKLEDEKCELSEPSSQLVEKLAEEWDLPPKIELDHRDDKLVVYERVATAKAI